jgi:hypothetical protein
MIFLGAAELRKSVAVDKYLVIADFVACSFQFVFGHAKHQVKRIVW